MTRGIDVSIAGHIHTLGVQHMCLPKTDLLRLALLAPRRLRDIADTDNAHGWWVWSVDNWIEHDHRNRKLRRQHVELLRLADIDGVLTRVVADAHASAHTQQFANRHVVFAEGKVVHHCVAVEVLGLQDAFKTFAISQASPSVGISLILRITGPAGQLGSLHLQKGASGLGKEGIAKAAC
jgi:hypothetical protein